MRVLIWATTLQADILALARHLDARYEDALLIVTEGAADFAREPIAEQRPFRAPLLERHDAATERRAREFAADVVVCDNHFPAFAAAPRVCAMWHGLGWKARPKADLPAFYAEIERLTGADPRGPNPRFLAQCYHERDRAWRIERWGLHPDACRVIGSCFSDLLLAPPYAREALAPRYAIPVLERKTVLVNFTWHYARIFPGSWQPRLFRRASTDGDLEFTERLFQRVADHGANVLFCLHDRRRYERSYLEHLERSAARFPRLELKYKDGRPDNLADLLVADVMVSNLSSFITFFYHLGRPSVHLCPRDDGEIRRVRLTRFGLRAQKDDAYPVWMNEPEDNGGLTAKDADQALACLDRALGDPACCAERARSWIQNHVHAADGATSARLARALRELASVR